MKRIGKKTDATARRHLVNIQVATRAPDGEGGFDTTWEDGIDTWASILPMS